MINGKTLSKTFTSKIAALKWKEDLREERARMKNSISGVFNGILFSDVCTEYLKTRVGTKEGTKETYKSVVRTHLLPEFGKLRMREIKKSHGIALIGKLENQKKSNSTINKILVILKNIMKYSIESEYIEVNPFQTIKPLKVDPENFKYWTGKEAQLFLSSVKGHPYFNLFKFALNTGLRRGELCGLQWRNVVDFNGKTALHFNEQLLPGRVRDIVKGNRKRFVPLSGPAIEVLNNIGRKGDRDYIFTMPNGKSVEPNYLSSLSRKIQREAGIKNVIKLHAMRHSFASLLVAKGANQTKIQKILGHADPSTTQRYMHLRQDDLMELIQMVDFSE